MTPAEKQKQYRQRLRQKAKTEPDLSASFPSSRFVSFLKGADIEQQLSFVDETLDSVGLRLDVPLSNDVDPEWREEWGTPNRGALGRSERMVDALIDVAKVLAELINTYKVRETETALAKLQSRRAGSNQKLIADAVRLNAIRVRLSKQVRHSFHETTVKGEQPT
jgi:hypothetical protein